MTRKGVDRLSPTKPDRPVLVEVAIRAVRKPSFSPEDLQPYIDAALARQRAEFEATMAAMAAQSKTVKKTDTSKSDAAIIKAFKAKGYENIVLLQRGKTLAEQGSTVTVLTFQKWMELGRKVKEHEHSLKIRGLPYRTFHKSQTRIATVEERKQNFAKVQAAMAKREAKAEQPAA
jgi:hypothetical protein